MPPVETFVTELQEPLLVTTLRQQIQRGASLVVLSRIAGSEAEYRRLVLAYNLRPHVKQPAKPVRLLPAGQSRLLEVITALAEASQEFPGAMALGRMLDCSWLVVERDLRWLARKGFIRVFHSEVKGRPVRRIAIAGTDLATAATNGR